MADMMDSADVMAAHSCLQAPLKDLEAAFATGSGFFNNRPFGEATLLDINKVAAAWITQRPILDPSYSGSKMEGDERIVTNDRGLLARFSILPAGSGAYREPCAPGCIYRPLGRLHLDEDNHNDIDALVARLWRGTAEASSESCLRTDLESVLAHDSWTMICPFRVGYETDNVTDNELTLVITVRSESMSVERAVAVVSEARKILTR